MPDQKSDIPITVDLVSDEDVEQVFHKQHRTILTFEVNKKPFTFFKEALFDHSPEMRKKFEKNDERPIPIQNGSTTVWSAFHQWTIKDQLCKNIMSLKWNTIIELYHFSEEHRIRLLSNDIIIHMHRRRLVQLQSICDSAGLQLNDDEQENKKPTSRKKPVLDEQELLDLFPKIPANLNRKSSLYRYLVDQFSYSHLQIIPKLRAIDLMKHPLHFLWGVLGALNTAIDIHFPGCEPMEQVYIEEEQPGPDFSACGSDLMNLIVRNAAVLRKELARTRKIETRQSFFGVENWCKYHKHDPQGTGEQRRCVARFHRVDINSEWGIWWDAAVLLK